MLADPRRARVTRLGGWGVVAGPLLMAVLSLEGQAQSVPTPAFALQRSSDTEVWVVRVEVPTGWALYAPDTVAVGLPLTARWIGSEGEAMLRPPLIGPKPLAEAVFGGTALVHRGRVRFSVAPPPPGAAHLELTWAICRVDLCVPGVTRLAAPQGRPGVTP